MRFALLFSGQGTQHPGLLPWLESAPASQTALEALQAVLGDGWRAGLEQAHTRSSNAFAQPLIVGTALAAWAALASHLSEPPAVAAGYSVGELAAFASAGVFTPQAAMALAVQRAALMDAAVAGLDTGLLSVSGLCAERVLQSCADLQCAIHLGAAQGIYAGACAALHTASEALTRQGALCKLLEVRVASHSRWMASAAQAFAQHLAQQPFARPQAALVLNASGASSRDPRTLRAALSAQIDHTVQWSACLDAVAEMGVDCVMEVGAGSTLSKMWNQRHPTVAARSLCEFRDAAGAARWMERQALHG